MLVDRYAPEDVFARAPEVAEQRDPVLKALDSDSGLLVDSVRVLSRHMQRAKPLIKEQVANVLALCGRRRSRCTGCSAARPRRKKR